MKKIINVFLLVLISFCFINVVFAQDSKKASDIYCKGEEGAKGCIYQGHESSLKYNTTIVDSENMSTGGQVSVSLTDGDFIKGYVAADKNNHLIYAACYKVDLRKTDKKRIIFTGGASQELIDKYNKGVYYVFDVYIPNSNSGECDYRYPSEKILYHATSNDYTTSYAIKGINNKTDAAKVDAWRSTLDGTCPKYLGSAMQNGTLKYIFTDNPNNIKNYTDFDEGYDTSCIVADTETEKTISACFNNKVQELKGKLQARTCPSDLASLKDLSKITDEYTKVDDCMSLGDGDTYSYSIIKKISDNYKVSVTNAVKTKYFSCALDICGLTDSEKSRVRDRVGSIYEDSDIGNLYSSGLDSSKISCLTSNVKKSDSIVDDIENDIDEAAKKKAEENNIERDTTSFTPVELKISDEPMSCEQMLGGVLHKVVKSSIRIVQIVAAIMAIVKGMLLIVPAVTSKDADELKKVSGTLVKLAIVLVIIFIMGPTVRLFGSLLGYDVSCLI